MAPILSIPGRILLFPSCAAARISISQRDNRTAGDVIYQMQVLENSPAELVVAIENVSPVQRFMLTLFNPGDLQFLHFLEHEGPNVWELLWLGLGGRDHGIARGAGGLLRQTCDRALPPLRRVPQSAALSLWRSLARERDPTVEV
jgi:hypothetical protein